MAYVADSSGLQQRGLRRNVWIHSESPASLFTLAAMTARTPETPGSVLEGRLPWQADPLAAASIRGRSGAVLEANIHAGLQVGVVKIANRRAFRSSRTTTRGVRLRYAP